MGLTQLGFILIPLCLIYAQRPDRLLQMILIFSVFEAAAAVVLGDIGLQPGLVPAMMFSGFIGLQLMLGVRYPGTGVAMRSLLPFILMTVYAAFSSYAMPHLFDGAVEVWPQKLAPGVNDIQPLHFSFFNLTQDMYLLMNCVILVLTALFTSRTNFAFLRLRNAYFLAGFIVVTLSFWQFASRLSGLYFPTDFLHSNPGWFLNGGQELGNVPRIDASFSEPSSLAIYLCGVIYGCSWAFVRGDRSTANKVLLGLALVAILMSTSTTGFAALAVGAVLLVLWSFISRSAPLIARTGKLILPLLAAMVIVTGVASVLLPAVINAATQVIDATKNKSDSASYDDRTGTDLTSLSLVGQTYGLGVGWGSNRSSSLIPGLLASLGIPGMVLCAWFGVSIVRRFGPARRQASPPQAVTLDVFMGSVLGQLIAACVSSPTISSPEFFAKLGIVIGCISRIEVDARAFRRRGPAVVRTQTLATAAH